MVIMGLSSVRAAFILVLMTSALPVVTSDPDFPPAQADILDAEGVSVLADPVDSFSRGDSEAYDSDLGSSERLDKLYGMLGLIHVNSFVRIGRALPSGFLATKRQMNKFVRIGRALPSGFLATKRQMNKFVRIGRRSVSPVEHQEQALGLKSPNLVKIARGGSMSKDKRQALYVNPEQFVRISRDADTGETAQRSLYLSQVVRMQPRAYVRIGRLPASVYLHRLDGGDDDGATGRRTSHFRLTSSSVTRAGKRTAD